MNELVKQESSALQKKPLEWLAVAKEVFADAMQRLSAAIIQDTDPTETAQIHDWAKRAGKALETFEKNARDRQLMHIMERGKAVTDKGTLEILLENGMKQRAVPTNSKPSDRLTYTMLTRKNLSPDAHMTKEVTWSADDAKLKHLVDQQLLTPDEYKQCFEAKVAYRVMAPVPFNEDEE